jgi:linoleoyl-CoA desaturase
MWKIHGKVYDLTSYLDKHPGGRLILESCQGEKDATAAFQSYHAMMNMDKIKEIMKKYEVGTCSSKFNFNENGFYNDLKKKVKNYFEQNNISHHANNFWVFKSTIQLLAYIGCLYVSFISSHINLLNRVIFSFLAGHIFIQLGFCVMHDASHLAISNNKHINYLLNNIWNSFSLWNTQKWSIHHCFYHHSYTGTIDDPDTKHFKPFIRKSNNEKKHKYLNLAYFPKLQFIFYTCFLPGMWFGQILSYLRWKNYLWGMKLVNYKSNIDELLINFLFLFMLIYSQNILVIFSYIISCNISYFVCIMPDHDTLNTHNNLISNIDKDWGELQVCNSGNFATSNSLVCNLFGGINYQIEHHLFPTICHVHFPNIKKIVKQTCIDYNIPYVDYKTTYEAVYATLENFENILYEKDKLQ